MIKKGRILSLILVMTTTFVVGQTKVNYKISYVNNLEEEGLKVQVSINLKKNADSTYFHYSNEVWGQNNLMNCLKFIKKDNPEYNFKIIADSNRIVVYHPKGKNVKFIYHIIQDVKVKTISLKHRPLVEKEYFHVLGESLFIVPEEIYKKKIDPQIIANIQWVNFPSTYKIHNTFGTNQKRQVLNVKLWSELYHSLFVGGDYRVYSFSHQNKPIEFAIRGTWLGEYQDEKLLNAIKSTITTQRDFWKDYAFDYYTIIFTPTVSQNDSTFKGQSITGSSIKNGFMILSSNNPFNNFNRIKHTLNHEIMHDWIAGKISMKNEELNYWFSEGFTDYYAFKNRLQSNDLTFQEWISLFNKEVLRRHWENPEKNKPNYLIKDDFWNNKNIEKVPYRRGAIFAFWVDNQILINSNYTKSLDDLMREILFICTSQNKKFTDELFLETLKKYLNEDISYFFQKHIINGEDIDFKKEKLIDEFTMKYENNIPQINSINEMQIKYILK